MISDDERREVAARLRVYSHDFDFDDSNPFWYVAKAAFGDVDAHTYYSVFARLADLIDRPTCHDVGGGYEFRCSACGCVIHIFRDGGFGEDDSAMTVGGDSLYAPHYCPNCGAEVSSGE